MGNIRVGISGWTFEPWRGTFYPDKLPRKSELRYASEQLSAIEINGTFYSLQKPKVFQNWYNEVPADFCFTVKAPKFITHVRRLKDCEAPLANFMASGLLCLGEKLGAILWQFPPFFPFKPDRFEEFLKMLPKTHKEAAEIAKGHSEFLKDTAYLKAHGDFPMRHAFEARHFSFDTPEYVELLRKYNVAIVVGDTAGKWPYMEDLTSDFVYVRMHGDGEKYPEGYTPKALDAWHERLKVWAAGSEPVDAKVHQRAVTQLHERKVFCFFDNDEKVTAPMNAVELLARVNGIAPKALKPKVAAAAKKNVKAKAVKKKVKAKKSA